jgi:hypothetical protein
MSRSGPPPAARVGQLLIDGTAHKMADELFDNFEQVVTPREPTAGNERETPAATPSRSGTVGTARLVWIGGGAVVLLVILWLQFGGRGH